jgi:hypothetical protein
VHQPVGRHTPTRPCVRTLASLQEAPRTAWRTCCLRALASRRSQAYKRRPARASHTCWLLALASHRNVTASPPPSDHHIIQHHNTLRLLHHSTSQYPLIIPLSPPSIHYPPLPHRRRHTHPSTLPSLPGRPPPVPSPRAIQSNRSRNRCPPPTPAGPCAQRSRCGSASGGLTREWPLPWRLPTRARALPPW